MKSPEDDIQNFHHPKRISMLRNGWSASGVDGTEEECIIYP